MAKSPSRSDERQKCPICLDYLFPSSNDNINDDHAKTKTTAKVGAIVPCGHCLHASCFRQWKVTQYRMQLSRNNNNSRATMNKTGCKCPLCKAPVQTFVTLFLDHDEHRPSNDNNNDTSNHENDQANDSFETAEGEEDDLWITADTSDVNNSDDPTVVTPNSTRARDAPATTSATTSTSNNTNNSNDHTSSDGPRSEANDNITAALLEQQERIRTKLKRYKRQNKSLKQELRKERVEMEEILVATIHNLYKMMDQHDDERERLRQQAVELQRQLTATQQQQKQERRQWQLQQEQMQLELHHIQRDCAQAEQRVQSATQGLDELKLLSARRQSKWNVLAQERAQLLQENRQLKHTVSLLATKSLQEGSVRSERRLR